MISWSKCRPRGNRISFSERFGRFNFCAEGGVIAAVTATRPAFRVLLGDGLSQWIYTAAITFPFQLLALASSKEGELLLARFGFYCYQKAHAMPDGVALFALDASREEFISLLKARGIHVAQM